MSQWNDVISREIDGRYMLTHGKTPLTTVAGVRLEVPNAPIAQEVAKEFQSQDDEKLDLEAMPIWGMCCLTLDEVEPERSIREEELFSFAETDTLFYRAPANDPITDMQHDAWDPLIDWIESEFDIRPVIVHGIIPEDQPIGYIERVMEVVAGLDTFTLTALWKASVISHSFIVAYALLKGKLSAGQAFDIAALEPLFSIDEWGEDPEAMDKLEVVKRDLEDIERYIGLLAAA